jgi:hypothetical protein
MTTAQARLLAERLEDTATWRRRAAEEYPDDRRNGHCADALVDLAHTVRTNPALTSAVTVLGTVAWLRDGVYWPCEDASNAIGRYGFGCGPTEPAAFIEWLIDLEREESA